MAISIEKLQEMRFLADDAADKTVQNIIDSGETAVINQLFHQLSSNADIPSDAHPEVLAFFNRQSQLPSDTDWELIRKGQRFFERHGPQVFLALFCKSLPECYSCWRGAKVLYMTGRLTEKAGDDFKVYSRRLMETAQFVIDVAWQHAFEPEGKAIMVCHKIRLIHAAIRHYILKHGKEWDTKQLGTPINQEDKAGTFLSFSVSVLEGVRAMGVKVNEEEEKGYYYLWTHIARLMGVKEELIPQDLEAARELKNLILEHQNGASKEGKALTKAASDFMAHMIPGSFFDRYPHSLMHQLNMPMVREACGLEDEEGLLEKLMMRATKLWGHMSSKFEGVSLLNEHFKRHMMEGMLRYFNERKEIQFNIPPSLKGEWGV